MKYVFVFLFTGCSAESVSGVNYSVALGLQPKSSVEGLALLGEV